MGGKKASRGFELAATYTHIQTSCKCGYIASAARERLIGALDEHAWVRVQLDDYYPDPKRIRKGNRPTASSVYHRQRPIPYQAMRS